MNRRRLTQILLLGLFSMMGLSSFASCQSCKNGHTMEKDSLEHVDTSDITPAFPSPTIPMTIQNVDERATYFVAHFWDECDFNDPELTKRPARIEQSMANFLGIASRLPLEQVKKPMLQPLESSRGELFSLFIDLYEKYLFEPNSPFFNEEYYYPIVEWITHSPKASLAQLERAKHRLHLLVLLPSNSLLSSLQARWGASVICGESPHCCSFIRLVVRVVSVFLRSFSRILFSKIGYRQVALISYL